MKPLEGAVVVGPDAAPPARRVPWRGPRALLVAPRAQRIAAASAFAMAVAVLAYRAGPLLNIPGQPDGIHVWMADFRDAIYYPVVAWLDGNNPYDAALFRGTYPVYNLFPIYSPLTLVLHLPFGLLPFVWSELAYAVATLALLLATVHLASRVVGLDRSWARSLTLAAALLLSRPGYLNVLLGQCTLQVVLGAYLALFLAARRPWLAAMGLALATIKPTYGAPLAILLLARGDVGVVLRGALVAGVPTLLATASLAWQAGGVGPLIATVPDNYVVTLHEDPLANALTSVIRIDLVALLTRPLGAHPGVAAEAAIALVVLGAAGIALWRLAQLPQTAAVRNLSAAVACLAILLCTYHQHYDLLLLIAPALAVCGRRWPPTPGGHLLLAAMVLLPFANHLLAGRVVDALQPYPVALLAVTSLNGAALLIAFTVCLIGAGQLVRRVP